MALIKKHRYSPKTIKGDDVNTKFADREVGTVDAWPGQLDGVKFHVSYMKEPDYVMILMTTYGTTELMGDARPHAYKIHGVKRMKTILYPEVVYNHFQFRDTVDDNNGIHMTPPCNGGDVNNDAVAQPCLLITAFRHLNQLLVGTFSTV